VGGVRTIVGVMGSGADDDPALLRTAEDLGAAVAGAGWVLLNGGRRTGVMDASARGAARAGGLVVGVLPDDHTHDASTHLDVAIRTGMGDARNVINVLSSDVVIALPGGAGTLSEVALALNAGRTVIALGLDPGEGFSRWRDCGRLMLAASVDEAIGAAREALSKEGRR
jgi:uncharacterized protein (TIGR00725 family)